MQQFSVGAAGSESSSVQIVQQRQIAQFARARHVQHTKDDALEQAHDADDEVRDGHEVVLAAEVGHGRQDDGLGAAERGHVEFCGRFNVETKT
jgi:hypothetical protein